MNQRQKGNWWGRNWKWFVPVGCLTFLALFVGSIIAIIFMVFSMMKSSDVYSQAVAQAKAHASVQQSVGTPIKEGLFVSGNINVSGPSGEANLSIPVSGPNGKATIYVVASKSAGRWTYSTLVVEVKDSGNRINLLE